MHSNYFDLYSNGKRIGKRSKLKVSARQGITPNWQRMNSDDKQIKRKRGGVSLKNY